MQSILVLPCIDAQQGCKFPKCNWTKSPLSYSKQANLVQNYSPWNSKDMNLIQAWVGPRCHTLYNAQTVFGAFPTTASGPLLLRVQQHTLCRWLNHQPTLNPLWFQRVKWHCLITFNLTFLLLSLLPWRWWCDLDHLMVFCSLRSITTATIHDRQSHWPCLLLLIQILVDKDSSG